MLPNADTSGNAATDAATVTPLSARPARARRLLNTAADAIEFLLRGLAVEVWGDVDVARFGAASRQIVTGLAELRRAAREVVG